MELIQGPAGSPWDATNGARFDHLGWWAESLDETTARLADRGLPIDFDGRDHGRRFAYHRVDSIGGRFEIVDAANQPAFLSTWDPSGAPAGAIAEAR